MIMNLYDMFDNQYDNFNRLSYYTYTEKAKYNYDIDTNDKEIIQKKESLITKLGMVINTIFKKIIDTIQSIIERIVGKENDMVEVPQNFEKVINERKKWYDAFGALISKISIGVKWVASLITNFIKKHPIITTAMVASVVLIPGGKYKKLIEVANSGFHVAQEALTKFLTKKPKITPEDQEQLSNLLKDARGQAEMNENIIVKFGKNLINGTKSVYRKVDTANKMYATASSVIIWKNYVMRYLYKDNNPNAEEIKNKVLNSPEYAKIVNNKKISDDDKKRQLFELYKKIEKSFK